MKNVEEDKKVAAINAIKLNTRMYNLTAIVVVFTLMFIIVNSVTSLVDYIPNYSIVALLSIVSILVVLNFYLSNKVATNAIYNMEEYEKKVNSLLTAMEKEMDSQKSTHEELEAQSLKDELTGLHNRHGFMPLAKQYLTTLNSDHSIAYIFYANIDNTKQINDTYGHDEGDSVIKTVANIIQDVYSGSDLVARIGADEFVVLPAGFTESGVELINSRLQEKFDELNSASGKKYEISISYVVAEYNPESPSSIEDLIDLSEKLMSEQKKKKQNS
jgi:diguanylate cyclase (GGDEF)-like protein